MSNYQMRKWQAQEARSERIEREKLAAGHDFDAEARARRIRSAESARESFADLEGFDAKIDAKVAEIRAEGPTTCGCGHEFCEAEGEGTMTQEERAIDREVQHRDEVRSCVVCGTREGEEQVLVYGVPPCDHRYTLDEYPTNADLHRLGL